MMMIWYYEVWLQCMHCEERDFRGMVSGKDVFEAKDQACLRWPDARPEEMVLRAIPVPRDLQPPQQHVKERTRAF